MTLQAKQLFELSPDFTEAGVRTFSFLNREAYVWSRSQCQPVTGARVFVLRCSVHRSPVEHNFVVQSTSQTAWAYSTAGPTYHFS